MINPLLIIFVISILYFYYLGTDERIDDNRGGHLYLTLLVVVMSLFLMVFCI